MELAINGGCSIRNNKEWPTWPQFRDTTLKKLESVLNSKRWAISGFWTGTEPLDNQFAKKFAEYIGTDYCIPTDHGSNALLIAMQSLGVSKGHEVIVPGLTWVACASSVLRLNAIPRLVDIDPNTQCLNPKSVEMAITDKTAAIIAVHLCSTMADMDELLNISKHYSIPIIEDCAQAHGATWRGKKAGSIGTIGVFSMQQGKVLTCGEGGAVVTSDAYLARKLDQLRNDGRIYDKSKKVFGKQQLEEVGEILGSNFAMSEFQLAVLIDGLDRLEEQNRIRCQNAQYLSDKLECITGLYNVVPYKNNDFRSYYHFVIRYDPIFFDNKPVEKVCEALSAELGFWIHPTYIPLNRNPLCGPHIRNATREEEQEKFNQYTDSLKEAENQYQTSILFHHSSLLGSFDDIDDIVRAFEKVQTYAVEL